MQSQRRVMNQTRSVAPFGDRPPSMHVETMIIAQTRRTWNTVAKMSHLWMQDPKSNHCRIINNS